MPRPIRPPPASILERFLREAANSFAQQASEVFTNSVAHAMDDALERFEGKTEDVLSRVRRARGVAQKRSRKGRRISR
jgi:hypothetical protein